MSNPITPRLLLDMADQLAARLHQTYPNAHWVVGPLVPILDTRDDAYVTYEVDALLTEEQWRLDPYLIQQTALKRIHRKGAILLESLMEDPGSAFEMLTQRVLGSLQEQGDLGMLGAPSPTES